MFDTLTNINKTHNAQVNRCRSAQGTNTGHQNGEAMATVLASALNRQLG